MTEASKHALLSFLRAGVVFLVSAAAVVILIQPPVPADAHIAPMHTHYPRIRHTVFEQFGVTATQTDVTYRVTQDNQPSIGTPVVTAANCSHSSFPFWITTQCSPVAWKVGSGATGYATGGMISSFIHTTGPNYDMVSYYNKRASEGGTFLCTINSGSLPYFWSDHCYAYLDGTQVGDY